MLSNNLRLKLQQLIDERFIPVIGSGGLKHYKSAADPPIAGRRSPRIMSKSQHVDMRAHNVKTQATISKWLAQQQKDKERKKPIDIDRARKLRQPVPMPMPQRKRAMLAASRSFNPDLEYVMMEKIKSM